MCEGYHKKISIKKKSLKEKKKRNNIYHLIEKLKQLYIYIYNMKNIYDKNKFIKKKKDICIYCKNEFNKIKIY